MAGTALTAGLALSTTACTQQTAQQLNTANANSQVYIGALTCNVTGSTGYVFGSSRDLSCVYLTKEGVSQTYDGKIRRFGLDLGTTKPGHVIWKVYQLGGLVGDKTSADPKVIAGNYGGEQASVSAGDAGYNLAYGIAETSLTLKN